MNKLDTVKFALIASLTASYALVNGTVASFSAEPAQTALQNFRITVDQPASAGLPVWIRGERDAPRPAHYPYSDDPRDFGNNLVEMRRFENHPLAALHSCRAIAVAPSGPVSGEDFDQPFGPRLPKNCLPLHLEFPLDKPGVYQVRWTKVRKSLTGGAIKEKETVLARSNWLTFTIKASTGEERKIWLKKKLANIPTSEKDLLSQYLPSLLSAAPDQAVLQVLVRQIYAHDGAGHGAVPNAGPASYYAATSLELFNQRDSTSLILNTIRQRGANELMAYYISWNAPQFENVKEQLVTETLPFLHARDNNKVSNSLTLLYYLANRKKFHWPADSSTLIAADKCVLAAGPSLVARHSQAIDHALAQYLGLGTVKQSRAQARVLLWKIVERPEVIQPESSEAGREQAIICLSWLGDPADLPKLGGLLSKNRKSDKSGHQLSNLPYQLKLVYGAQAIPYLKKGLTDSPYPSVRTECRYVLETDEQQPTK